MVPMPRSRHLSNRYRTLEQTTSLLCAELARPVVTLTKGWRSVGARSPVLGMSAKTFCRIFPLTTVVL